VKTTDFKKFVCAVGTIVLLLGCASAGVDVGDEAASTTDAVELPETEAAEGTGDTAPAEEPPVNRLKWTTATEVDNFGFDLYRSTSEEGPFERINAEPVPGAGTVDEPSFYVYVDDAIDPTRDYYYYIESISIDGVRERFSPIMKAPAKKPGKTRVEGSEEGP
jgi:hypothetical protein